MSVDYGRYMASREWALKRAAVRQRSGGICDRCKRGKAHSVHHETYERLGHELLSDLIAVCKPCHEWLSGKSDIDPIAVIVRMRDLLEHAKSAASENEAIADAQGIVMLRRQMQQRGW